MNEKLQMIMTLMEELQDEMQMGEEDFNQRLGRKKPEVAVVDIEVKPEMEEESGDELSDLDMDLPMGDETDDPESELKKRIMGLRK